jgi:hypothetical protein
MKILTKATLLVAGAASLIATAPANARYRGGGHDGIDTGDIIAGALILGGVAAIASAASSSSRYGRSYGGYDRGYDRGYRNDRYNNDYGYYRDGYGSRQAVDQCVRAAQRDASRYGWARVTDVTSIDRVRGGYKVRGRLVVQDRGRGYDRGYHYDRYDDGYDKGRFSCVSRYGQIDGLSLSGLNGYGNRYGRYDRYDRRYGY